MNQYDLQKLTKDETRLLRKIADGLIAFILLMAAIAFSGCAEKEAPPTLEERLQGAWIRTWGDFTQTYSFNGGQSLEHSIIPGQPVQLYTWQYFCNADTLAMINLASSEPFSDVRRAVVSFSEDGNEARFEWFPNGVDYILTQLK